MFLRVGAGGENCSVVQGVTVQHLGAISQMVMSKCIMIKTYVTKGQVLFPVIS